MPFLPGARSSPDFGNVHELAVLVFSHSDFCAQVFNEELNVAKPDTASEIPLLIPG